MMTDLPATHLKILQVTAFATVYTTWDGTNGHVWCKELVAQGFMSWRGTYSPQSVSYDKIKDWIVHIYDLTLKGRQYVGVKYVGDPEIDPLQPGAIRRRLDVG